MKKGLISGRLFCIFCGLSCIIGVLMLVVSFNINPGPPPDATLEQLKVFGRQYYAVILWGGWLQAVGPFFIVLFALGIVSLADAGRRLSGLMTLFGASTLMTVSLIEITFYITVLFKDPPQIALIGLNIIYAVQHLYFIIAAPALFIPLGVVILNSEVLPRTFGYLAILLGACFALLGVLFLLKLVLPMLVTAFAGVQVLWWLSASISLIVRSKKTNLMPASSKTD